jgi:hypothetical protein
MPLGNAMHSPVGKRIGRPLQPLLGRDHVA